MPEIHGLQIEARCIRCGRLPVAGIQLYEMRNHLYICTLCRQQAEAQGKQIAWVNDQQALPLSSPLTATRPKMSTQKVTLPPDSIFALLELPLETSLAQMEEAIRQKMRECMRDPDKRELIPHLREWQEKLQDDEAFETYRASLRPAPGQRNSLSVGGRRVTTLEEFLTACEESAAGWADGERYLRSGQLRQWIFFQLDDREMATQIHRYQTWQGVSNFRALNAALYCLAPQRPFRLYTRQTWQPLNNVLSAKTPRELAALCDKNWRLAEDHLYEGSLLLWLASSCGIKGLIEYYDACVMGYADKGPARGVGLELILERALPDLERPHLEVVIDGQPNGCTIERWDREIQHRPLSVRITNTTRGYTLLQFDLQGPKNPAEPNWIMLNASPKQRFAGRPGAGMPLSRELSLHNLPQLKGGRKYQRTLTVYQRAEYDRAALGRNYPITLKTMHFFQGMRGLLWLCGLRGGLPGLLWNFALGSGLAFLLFFLLASMLSNSPVWLPSAKVTLADVVSALLIGIRWEIAMYGHLMTLGYGAILGCIGFLVGRGKGHSNYTQQQGAKTFRTAACWSLIVAAFLPLSLNPHGAIQQADAYGNSSSTFLMLSFVLSSLAIGLLSSLLACLISFGRFQLEKFLRTRYQGLLQPEGRA